MILPAGVKDMNVEELTAALISEGYSEEAAAYVAKRVKGEGSPDDKRPLV